MELVDEEAIPVRNRWWIVWLVVAVVGGSALASLLPGRAGEGAEAMEPPGAVVSVHAAPFRAGDQSWFALTLGMMTRQTTTLAFNTAQRFDFAIYAEDAVREDEAPDAAEASEALWRWSEGRMFAQVVGREAFEANRLHLFTVAWDGTDRSGEALPPGRYLLEGWLTTSTQRLVAQGWIDIP